MCGHNLTLQIIYLLRLYTSCQSNISTLFCTFPERVASMSLFTFLHHVLQADVQEISGEAYITFGIILFFWELLPTSLVVVFFRVQKPNQNLVK